MGELSVYKWRGLYFKRATRRHDGDKSFMENYQACDKYSGDRAQRGCNKSDQGFAAVGLSIGCSLVALHHRVTTVADKVRERGR